jgi:hypothetical protein
VETKTVDRDDPVELLHRLTADELADRIDRLEGQINSLRVLLRAARARERRESRGQIPQSRKGGRP